MYSLCLSLNMKLCGFLSPNWTLSDAVGQRHVLLSSLQAGLLRAGSEELSEKVTLSEPLAGVPL
jgi:hypothetical protein